MTSQMHREIHYGKASVAVLSSGYLGSRRPDSCVYQPRDDQYDRNWGDTYPANCCTHSCEGYPCGLR